MKMNKQKAIREAKKILKVEGIEGIWNFWLLENGKLHKEYQCGIGEWFSLIKDHKGKIRVYKNEGE